MASRHIWAYEMGRTDRRPTISLSPVDQQALPDAHDITGTQWVRLRILQAAEIDVRAISSLGQATYTEPVVFHDERMFIAEKRVVVKANVGALPPANQPFLAFSLQREGLPHSEPLHQHQCWACYC